MGGEFYATKRGVEMLLFKITIVLFVVFIALAFLGGVGGEKFGNVFKVSNVLPAMQKVVNKANTAVVTGTGSDAQKPVKREFMKIKTDKGEQTVPVDFYNGSAPKK